MVSKEGELVFAVRVIRLEGVPKELDVFLFLRGLEGERQVIGEFDGFFYGSRNLLRLGLSFRLKKELRVIAMLLDQPFYKRLTILTRGSLDGALIEIFGPLPDAICLVYALDVMWSDRQIRNCYFQLLD